MKKSQRIILIVSACLVLLNAGLLLSGQRHIYATLFYNLPGIDDYTIFHNRTIQRAPHPQAWSNASVYNKRPLSDSLLKNLEALQTVSFLVIQGDSVLAEKYWGIGSDRSHTGSFSMSKSFVSALIGRAIALHYIKSTDQNVGDFIPAFNTEGRQHITLKHLLLMSSGLGWDEAYSSAFSETTKAYYGYDLKQQMESLTPVKKPGVYFEYKSCDTEILALVLTKATGMSVSAFMQQELWQPMGAESDAYWSLDHADGMEKAYCCISSNARDFARLLKLYTHKGNWNGAQLIDTAFVEASVTASGLPEAETGMPTGYYGYQWWVIPDYKGYRIFYMRGILGQYGIAIPELDCVIVRLGHKRGEKEKGQPHYPETFLMIDEALALCQKAL